LLFDTEARRRTVGFCAQSPGFASSGSVNKKIRRRPDGRVGEFFFLGMVCGQERKERKKRERRERKEKRNRGAQTPGKPKGSRLDCRARRPPHAEGGDRDPKSAKRKLAEAQNLGRLSAEGGGWHPTHLPPTPTPPHPTRLKARSMRRPSWRGTPNKRRGREMGGTTDGPTGISRRLRRF